MTRAQELYEKMAETLQSQFDIERKRKGGFGSGLRINGQVFAMFSQGALVIKGGSEWVAELVREKKAVLYQSGGRVSPGWAVILQEEDWLPLATAALELVLSKKGVKNENGPT